MSLSSSLRASVDATMQHEQMLSAIRRHDLGKLVRYLERGYDINAVTERGDTVGMEIIGAYERYLLTRYDIKALLVLIDYGLDLNHQNILGETALSMLCFKVLKISEHSHRFLLKLVQILLERGADPNLTDVFGISIVQHLQHKANDDPDVQECLAVLLSHGATETPLQSVSVPRWDEVITEFKRSEFNLVTFVRRLDQLKETNGINEYVTMVSRSDVTKSTLMISLLSSQNNQLREMALRYVLNRGQADPNLPYYHRDFGQSGNIFPPLFCYGYSHSLYTIQPTIVRLLLKYGANPSSIAYREGFQTNFLELVCEKYSRLQHITPEVTEVLMEIIDLLYDYGARFDKVFDGRAWLRELLVKNFDRQNPDTPPTHLSPELFRFLVRHGVSVDNSCLWDMIRYNRAFDLVKVLVDEIQAGHTFADFYGYHTYDGIPLISDATPEIRAFLDEHVFTKKMLSSRFHFYSEEIRQQIETFLALWTRSRGALDRQSDPAALLNLSPREMSQAIDETGTESLEYNEYLGSLPPEMVFEILDQLVEKRLITKQEAILTKQLSHQADTKIFTTLQRLYRMQSGANDSILNVPEDVLANLIDELVMTNKVTENVGRVMKLRLPLLKTKEIRKMLRELPLSESKSTSPSFPKPSLSAESQRELEDYIAIHTQQKLLRREERERQQQRTLERRQQRQLAIQHRKLAAQERREEVGLRAFTKAQERELAQAARQERAAARLGKTAPRRVLSLEEAEQREIAKELRAEQRRGELEEARRKREEQELEDERQHLQALQDQAWEEERLRQMPRRVQKAPIDDSQESDGEEESESEGEEKSESEEDKEESDDDEEEE